MRPLRRRSRSGGGSACRKVGGIEERPVGRRRRRGGPHLLRPQGGRRTATTAFACTAGHVPPRRRADAEVGTRRVRRGRLGARGREPPRAAPGEAAHHRGGREASRPAARPRGHRHRPLRQHERCVNPDCADRGGRRPGGLRQGDRDRLHGSDPVSSGAVSLSDGSRQLGNVAALQAPRRRLQAPGPELRPTAPTTGTIACPHCHRRFVAERYAADLNVCSECGHHGVVGAAQRIDQLADAGTAEVLAIDVGDRDPLGFDDGVPYPQRVERARASAPDSTRRSRSRKASIEGQPVVLACMDFAFLGGSLGRGGGRDLRARV